MPLFAEIASQIADSGAGWAALVLAVLGIVRNELTNYNTRVANRDKAEADRLAVLDKQTFDLKVLEIERDAARKDELIEEMREELSKCREQHAAAEVRMGASETDRQAMRARIAELEKQIQMLADR